MHPNVLALGAVALWASLALLSVSLSHVPPFLLTGLALLVGCLPSLPQVLRTPSVWRVPPRTLALGVYGLFGFHFLLFMALRTAPPVQANLVNYLWPLFIVVLAPVLLPNTVWRVTHVAAALLGFVGAALAILGGAEGRNMSHPNATSGASLWSWGYALALASAVIWATYSLWTRRVPHFSTAAVGLFALVSGLLSLLCHWALEVRVVLSAQDGGLIALMGLGPLGLAFYLWDRALKTGDARQIGVLSYITPVASTAALLLGTGQSLSWAIAAAAGLIVAAALLGTRR